MPASSLRSSTRPVAGRTLWRRTLRWLGWSSMLSIDKVRRLCLDVIDDVPPWHKQGLVSRISHLRHPSDVPEIKPHLFEAVCMHLGEGEARTRINRLDTLLS
jgi:hypothetical protein